MSNYENRMQWWIISVFNSEGASKLYRMFGNRQMARNKLIQLINKDKETDEDNWDMGTETSYELDAMENNGIGGFNNFYDYSIEYQAYPYNDIEETDVDRERRTET